MSRTVAGPPTEPLVELVVVHGIGRQTAGQTLLEWAEPILQRMDWLAKGSPAENGATPSAQAVAEDAARRSPEAGLRPTAPAEAGTAQPDDDSQGEPTALEFGAVVLGTANDEVTASIHYLDLEATPRSVALHITEARWSEAFLPLSRTQIFTWGLGFVFRAVGRLLVYLSTAFWVTSRGFWGIGRVIAVMAIAALGLVVGVLTLVAVVFLALSGPLLIFPFVGTALKPVVDSLVDFVGDVPAWTQRPTRAAAMRQIVATAVGAARARAGDDGRVMVVAHSEGAAITANLLFGDAILTPGLRVDTLVTVGSALSLLGRPSFTSHRLSPAELAAHGLSLTLNPVRAWGAMPAASRPRWLDFFATWDVIPSGPTSTGGAARRTRWTASYAPAAEAEQGALADSPALGPEEHPVHNTASALTDHQSYSANIVQVIDPLARIVLGLETRDPATGKRERPLVAAGAEQNRLHVRAVKELGLNRLLVLLLAALCFFVPTLSELFRLTTTGPVSVVTTALKWLLQVKDGEGIWGWLFSLTWVPYFALVAGAAALLLWANGALWQLFETRLASSRYDRPAVPRLRVWGLIVRVPLALGLAAGATIAARVHPLVLVGSLIAAVAVIAAPWFGRIPRTLAARTQPPD
ncbi:hypothetical protein [Frigoribacterium sp. UYMn621]|jgi:hypothetical protein|uniref:hypothetical protein n=1 Tax=Frigoribacterium sp. UYMn621 TaxID=3156343 RepID=UPI0033965820